MNEKIYIMNEQRYKQVEIEVQQMDEDKTVLFLVPEKEENNSVSKIQEMLWGCQYTIPEVLEEMKENGCSIFYMCTMYDDRIENENIKGVIQKRDEPDYGFNLEEIPNDFIPFDRLFLYGIEEVNVKLADGRRLNIHECEEGYDWTLFDHEFHIIDGGVYDDTDVSLKEVYEILAKDYGFERLSVLHTEEEFIENMDSFSSLTEQILEAQKETDTGRHSTKNEIER